MLTVVMVGIKPIHCDDLDLCKTRVEIHVTHYNLLSYRITFCYLHIIEYVLTVSVSKPLMFLQTA